VYVGVALWPVAASFADGSADFTGSSCDGWGDIGACGGTGAGWMAGFDVPTGIAGIVVFSGGAVWSSISTGSEISSGKSCAPC